MNPETFELFVAVYELVLAEHDLNEVRSSSRMIPDSMNRELRAARQHYFEAQGKVREAVEQAIKVQQEQKGTNNE